MGALVGVGIDALITWNKAWYWKTLVGIGSVVAIVAGGLLYSFNVGPFHERGGREIPAQTEPPLAKRMQLELRFAPVLKLNSHPVERFVPIDLAAYVDQTELKERVGSTETLIDASPSVATLPSSKCSLTAGCSYFLDVRGAEPDPPERSELAYHSLQQEAIAHGAREVVYAHVTQYTDSGEYAVQYWFLYFFNYRLNEHESDWEQITIHLSKDADPIDAYYSAHVCGHVRTWNTIEHPDGDHPVDYVAAGSHANYFRPSTPSVALKVVSILGGRRCLLERAFHDIADGRGTELRLDHGYEVDELSGPAFAGSYGSGNYIRETKRRPDVLSDPRTRNEWLDPLALFGS